MKKLTGFRYTIQWHSPHTEPPDGQPRVKAEMFETTEQRREREARGERTPPEWFRELHKIGDGYCIGVQHISPPPRQLPRETLASVRRKRLRRRIEKKYPLFAEQMIAEEMAKKPAYYDGITDPHLQAGKDAALAAWRELYERFLIAVGQPNQRLQRTP